MSNTAAEAIADSWEVCSHAKKTEEPEISNFMVCIECDKYISSSESNSVLAESLGETHWQVTVTDC
jgi:hypothetical protein